MAKKTESQPDRHKVPKKTFRFSEKIIELTQALAKEERRKSLTEMIEILIEDALRARGKWK